MRLPAPNGRDIADRARRGSILYPSGNADPCLGGPDITVGTDEDVQFCVEVENAGETPLTDVRIRSAVLRIRPADNTRFGIAQGSPSRVEPGELLVATVADRVEDGRLAGRVATRGVHVDFEVTAVPLDADEAPLDVVSHPAQVAVVASDDRPLTFGDAVRNGTDALTAAGHAAALIVGTLLPWSPLIVAIAAGIWWARRRRRKNSGLAAPPAEDPDE